MSDPRAPNPSRLAAAAVVHPFPSLLNSGLVLVLALVAGGAIHVALGLALAMLGLQLSIGAFNDYCDVTLDAVAKPAKPIPAGHVSRRTAALTGALAGGGGLALAAAFGAIELLLAAAMLGCGLAYDFALKRGPLGWLCLAVALPLLPVFAWYGAAGVLPPRPELLLPLAALSTAGLLYVATVHAWRRTTLGLCALSSATGLVSLVLGCFAGR